ncbi:hypothetical protein ILUMI_09967 [Ignelater luminosus]|uniref:DUF1308 domain-containing protein n=1 Tax=Ignelater luminosus TaxID=2038154 RepID=A0A8K0D451_IGNLU|nr:hypothetical protein ILUMI_09967 [Ignelater luminosus]
MDNEDDVDLIQGAFGKIEYGENLIKSLSGFADIEGSQKLNKKIRQEINFLKKICRSKNIKKEHLQCSNLTHFSALVKTLDDIKGCISVNKVFKLEDRKIVVDIICEDGLSWVKVVARNPKSLAQISMGDTNYGVRSILDQAEEYICCAQLYPCLFQTPKIIFVFANGISYGLAGKLESLGIVVEGNRIEDIDLEIDNETTYESRLTTKNTSSINKVNIDVSTMLAYVSSVTNGSCSKYKFTTPVLTQQAEWESERPVKPILDAFFKDKKLYCCETARNSFIEIINTVGGPNEKKRAEEFLARIVILPDNATALDTVETNANNEVFDNVQFTSNKTLSVGGKIRERSLIIFTFGDRIQAVTATSNVGFVQAAKQQGINFVVFVHESRALTEQKEAKAERLE